jgi:DNA-binding GntR family transcriptional regulator
MTMKAKKEKQCLVDNVKEALFLSHTRDEGPLSEDLLADQFGVSRTPIREALKELEQEGIIERRQKRGIVLRKFTPREIKELFEIREVLEIYAFGLACERVRDRDIQSLRKISHRHDAALRRGDVWNAENLDLEFHAGIIDIGGNLYLIKLVKTLHVLSQAFQISKQLVDHYTVDDQFPHQEIVDALARKDSAKGITLLKQHIQNSKQTLLEISQP